MCVRLAGLLSKAEKLIQQSAVQVEERPLGILRFFLVGQNAKDWFSEGGCDFLLGLYGGRVA